MKPYLFVIKVNALTECVNFYQSLGLELKEESHGDGVVHYSCNFEGVVWELYPASKEEQPSNNRLGFQLSKEHTQNPTILSFLKDQSNEIHDFGNGQYYTVIKDPDGRAVEIVFKQ